MTISKKEFIDQLVSKHSYTKKAAKMLVEDFLDVLVDNIEHGNGVYFYGFGTFGLVQRAARECRNPNTGERCPVPPHWVPRFWPGNTLKRAVKTWVDNEERGIK